MQIGFVGLGRMGLNMVTRLRRGGHTVVAYDRSADAVARAGAAGARGVSTLEALVEELSPPRAVWVMVPAGEPTESTVSALGRLLSAGDAIIDGGNTNFHDDVRRAQVLGAKRLDYVDAGTSGGIWGLQEGYCLMVGGKADVCKRLEPIFLTLAPPDGYLRVGDHGAGHYVKMVHNAHRVRADAGVRRRLRADARERVQDRSGRGCRPLEPRQRRALVAAGTGGARAGRGCRFVRRSRDTSRIPAKGAGRCTKRSIAACRCRSCPPRCSRGSARATTTRSPSGCWRRCGISSAATP